MQFRWWHGCLIRNGRSKPRTTYLSDTPGALGGIVVSKQVTTYNDTFMRYTSFSSYVELYYFLKETPVAEKSFHEVALSSANQKPRFDIDISLEDYIAYFKTKDVTHEELAEFGEWVKDLVLETSIAVLEQYGICLSVEKDFFVFTSHSPIKRSYHIVMSNFMHRGCEQAGEFYRLCGNSLSSEKTRQIYWKFVDGGAYNKNKSLRILWCRKGERVKVHNKKFNYKGNEYTQTHHLLDGDMSLSLYNKRLLSISLITFTSGCSDMPLFPIEDRCRYDSSDIPEAVLKECNSIISSWDTNNVFVQRYTDDGKIQMIRKKSSQCLECGSVHDKRPGFCTVSGNSLYFHCGKEGVRGVWIGRLNTVASPLDIRLNRLRQARGLDPLPLVSCSVPVRNTPSGEVTLKIDEPVDIDTDSFAFEYINDKEEEPECHPSPSVTRTDSIVKTEPWQHRVPKEVIVIQEPPSKVFNTVTPRAPLAERRLEKRRQQLGTESTPAPASIPSPSLVDTMRGKVPSTYISPSVVTEIPKPKRSRPK